ncbi:hypothetical protein CNEO4_2410002 [Clostridium neonatale]|nr:hypothetical protein CNEO3_1440003 [Clostridium neonatale]CAI3576386.1 hypothetical protein CNEO3_1620003 [Clostridium neonatale]CAI3587205.1 hypothetical protein CNEO3_2020002 [Clostridium neonatale]CAI3603865.1 hypothetical protein CNEO4_1910002 [Clostridium neonatale]CAI3605880.1 hypothetical protein CNEO4_1620001 [Clostridium neonatale]
MGAVVVCFPPWAIRNNSLRGGISWNVNIINISIISNID